MSSAANELVTLPPSGRRNERWDTVGAGRTCSFSGFFDFEAFWGGPLVAGLSVLAAAVADVATFSAGRSVLFSEEGFDAASAMVLLSSFCEDVTPDPFTACTGRLSGTSRDPAGAVLAEGREDCSVKFGTASEVLATFGGGSSDLIGT